MRPAPRAHGAPSSFHHDTRERPKRPARCSQACSIASRGHRAPRVWAAYPCPCPLQLGAFSWPVKPNTAYTRDTHGGTQQHTSAQVNLDSNQVGGYASGRRASKGPSAAALSRPFPPQHLPGVCGCKRHSECGSAHEPTPSNFRHQPFSHQTSGTSHQTSGIKRVTARLCQDSQQVAVREAIGR